MENRNGCSIILVKKIILALYQRGSMGRTELSQTANIHYSKLVEHLSLLERKDFVEPHVAQGRVVLGLSEKGRKFGTMLLELHE